jgi:hypothetical protein
MVALSGGDSVATRDRSPSAIRIGDVFGQSRKTFVAHWAPCCGIWAIGYAPVVIWTKVVPYAAGANAVWTTANALLAFVFLVLPPVAVYFGVAQDIRGGRFSFGQSIYAALSRSPAILGLMLLIGLYAILAALLLVIPGVIVFCMYSVALPACVVERLGPLRSMSRSAFLTRGNRWNVFGLLFLLYFVSGVAEQLVRFASMHVAGGGVSLAVSFPIEVVVGAFSAVATGVLYMQLRVAREGSGAEHIVSVFD